MSMKAKIVAVVVAAVVAAGAAAFGFVDDPVATFMGVIGMIGL